MFLLIFPILILSQTNQVSLSNIALMTLLCQDDTPIMGDKNQEVEASVYNQTTFRCYNLDITQDNIRRMIQDPSNETKVHANFTINYGTPFAITYSSPTIGAGYKGSIGSLRICFDEYGSWNGDCRRLGITVNMQEFKDNTSTSPLENKDVFKFRRFNFNGMPVDLSMVSERTAFYLMRKFGMIAPYSAHAKLFINGEFMGIYSLIEPINEDFTSIRFNIDDTKGKGGLYKQLWLNEIHMKTYKKTLQSKTKSDNSFMVEVMNAIRNASLTSQAAISLVDKYFDVDSFVNMTALNSVINSWDDWKIRHNFYLYVRKDKTGKKIVFIPWDFDRLYDQGVSKNLVQGKVWWDLDTGTPSLCNIPVLTPHEQAEAICQDDFDCCSTAMVEYNTDLYANLPPDISIPVTCDKFTKLLSLALTPQVKARIRYFASHINMSDVQHQWQTWSNQIQLAVSYDTQGPTVANMLVNQQLLRNAITTATGYFVNVTYLN